MSAMKLKLKKGALHKQLGVPQGNTIPLAMIQSASHSKNPLTRKRANFAINARKWKKK
jgi:hypothetical protein